MFANEKHNFKLLIDKVKNVFELALLLFFLLYLLAVVVPFVLHW